MTTAARIVLTIPMLPPRHIGVQASPADFLEADATVPANAPGGPFHFDRVSVEEAQVDYHFVVMGERRPDGRSIEDLWITSDGMRVHFRVKPKDGLIPVGIPGLVRVIFKSVDGHSELEATARFTTGPDRTLVLSSGVSTSPGGFYTGPSPGRELVIRTAPPVNVGLKHWDAGAEPDGLRKTWQALRFDTWLDDSLPAAEVATEAPSVKIDSGRVRVSSWQANNHGRYAQIEYDPRDPAQRLQVGRHTLTIVWTTHVGAGTNRYQAEAIIGVRDDGTVELERQPI